MHRTLCALILLLAGLALPARAQDRVEAKLYQRVEGDAVQVAIEFRVEPGFHIYHEETGHEKAVGKPTRITLDGGDVEFGAIVWPEPHKHDQPDFGAWIWIHEGRFRVYAQGLAAEGEPVGEVSALVDGQVCDAVGCTLFKLDLESSGEGTERIWKDFPAELEAQAAEFEDLGGNAEEEIAEEPAVSDFTFGAQDGAKSQGAGPPELRGHLYVRSEGDTARAVIELEVARDWHWYHHELGNPKAMELPAKVELTGAGVEWGALAWPEPKKHTNVLGEWAWVHFGKLVLRAEGRVVGASGPGKVGAKIQGQVCDEDGVCTRVDFALADAGRGPDALFSPWPEVATTGGSSEAGQGEDPGSSAGGLVTLDDEGEDEGGSGLLKFLLAAFGGGLFALMMPCTYPMIPITISFFTKQADARGGKVLSLSLVYGAGIVLIFILIGVLVGPIIIAFAQHPVTNLVIGLAFLFFALVLFGVMELRPPQFLMAAAGKATMRGGYIGVFMMGATLVITSFTCTAPFVGGLLGAGAAEGALSVGEIALGMGVFGLTMAVPFVFLSLVPGRISAMPKSGEWMNTLKVTLGFVEVAAALKFLSNTDLVWEWNVLSRELFLLLWTAIFAITAAYLFGWIRLKQGEATSSSPGRMVGGLLFLGISLYCWLGFRGFAMDKVMNSIVPPYSASYAVGATGSSGAPGGGAPVRVAAKGHTVVKDDYEGARELAEREGKLLFVNFTGFT